MRFLDADAVTALEPAAAVAAITAALQAGLDPATDPQRLPVEVPGGQLLLMPSHSATTAGVKIVGVAPGNRDLGLPRIHGVYVLFHADTLVPIAVLDGGALTAVRTPAVSVAAVQAFLPQRPLRVAIVGAGPQAVGHAGTLAAVRPTADVTYLVRDPRRTSLPALALGTVGADTALADADVIVCATSARTPVLDSTVIREDAIVIAVGSHQPDARELDAQLLRRSTVVVEDTATALREAGDVVLAIAEGALTSGRLVPMRDAVLDPAELPTDRPLVFKSVGMAWQDLLIATAATRLAGD